MNFSGCEFLEKIPDFSKIPNIKHLDLNGPSTVPFFGGLLPGVFLVGGPQNGSGGVGGLVADVGGVNEDVGGATGAREELNGFPSFLKFGMLRNYVAISCVGERESSLLHF
ncbi:hypothetical protein C1H46_008788 [Malus baccata]|uniref:Uncharacterized protein n=1 Tax=Malus baccata TaxID=106549 RepID=A0A540N3N9_MALBA|nr:hypothetical protein C1H46_008788 [Malus baccata]